LTLKVAPRYQTPRFKDTTMTVLLLAIALGLAAADAPEDATGKDLERMQGNWMADSVSANGIKWGEDESQALFRTVKEDAYTVARYSKQLSAGTFTIDATQSPKTIDSTPRGAAAGQPVLGIYEFDGEALRICNAQPGKPRPKDFKARIGSNHTLILWIRETQ
jgi:uncharacterized protein (TIGR03067 family)